MPSQTKAESAVVPDPALGGAGWRSAIRKTTLRLMMQKRSSRKTTPLEKILEEPDTRDMTCQVCCEDCKHLKPIFETRAVHPAFRLPTVPEEPSCHPPVYRSNSLKPRLVEIPKSQFKFKQSQRELHHALTLAKLTGEKDTELQLPAYTKLPKASIPDMSWEGDEQGGLDQGVTKLSRPSSPLHSSSFPSRSATVSPLSFSSQATTVTDMRKANISPVMLAIPTSKYNATKPNCYMMCSTLMQDNRSEDSGHGCEDVPTIAPKVRGVAVARDLSLPPPYEGTCELDGSSVMDPTHSQIAKSLCQNCQHCIQDNDFYDFCPKCPDGQSILCLSCARIGGCSQHTSQVSDYLSLEKFQDSSSVEDDNGEATRMSAKTPMTAELSIAAALNRSFSPKMDTKLQSPPTEANNHPEQLNIGVSAEKLDVKSECGQGSEKGQTVRSTINFSYPVTAAVKPSNSSHQAKLGDTNALVDCLVPQACSPEMQTQELMLLLKNEQCSMQVRKAAVALKEKELLLREREMAARQLNTSIMSSLGTTLLDLAKLTQLGIEKPMAEEVVKIQTEGYRRSSAKIDSSFDGQFAFDTNSLSMKSDSRLNNMSISLDTPESAGNPRRTLAKFVADTEATISATKAAEAKVGQGTKALTDGLSATSSMNTSQTHFARGGKGLRERPGQKRKQTESRGIKHLMASKQNSTGTTSKRTPQDRVQQRDQDDETNEDGSTPPKRHRPRLSDSEPVLRLFACPYAKFDPRRYSTRNLNRDEKNYRNCSHSLVENISRLKQHLVRTHWQPESHCRRCFKVFRNLRELDDHLAQAIGCEPAECPFPEKMDKQKQERIHRKRPLAPLTDQWYDIYKILFPGSPLPDSPFVEDNEPSSPLSNTPSATTSDQAVQMVSRIFNASIDNQGGRGALSPEQCNLIRQEFMEAIKAVKLSLSPIGTGSDDSAGGSPPLRSPVSQSSPTRHSFGFTTMPCPPSREETPVDMENQRNDPQHTSMSALPLHHPTPTSHKFAYPPRSDGPRQQFVQHGNSDGASGLPLRDFDANIHWSQHPSEQIMMPPNDADSSSKATNHNKHNALYQKIPRGSRNISGLNVRISSLSQNTPGFPLYENSETNPNLISSHTIDENFMPLYDHRKRTYDLQDMAEQYNQNGTEPSQLVDHTSYCADAQLSGYPFSGGPRLSDPISEDSGTFQDIEVEVSKSKASNRETVDSGYGSNQSCGSSTPATRSLVCNDFDAVDGAERPDGHMTFTESFELMREYALLQDQLRKPPENMGTPF